MKTTTEKVTFWGTELNAYEIENRRLSYATMAHSFNAVMCNNITEIDPDFICNIESGEIYRINGETYTEQEKNELIEKLEEDRDALGEIIDKLSDDLDALYKVLNENENAPEAERNEIKTLIEEKQKAIESREEQREELDRQLEEAENAETDFPEVFQWFIVEDSAAWVLKKAGEPLFYSDKLDCYIWGVTHFGTSWDYVLTSLELDNNFSLK